MDNCLCFCLDNPLANAYLLGVACVALVVVTRGYLIPLVREMVEAGWGKALAIAVLCFTGPPMILWGFEIFRWWRVWRA